MFDLLYQAKTRNFIAQLFVFVLLCSLALFAITNAISNLDTQGVVAGFDFLNHRAGFSILQTLIPYTEESTYGRAFLIGLSNTFLVSALGIMIATLLGFTIGVARLSHNWLVNRLAAFYIETIRNMPLLLQIFFWYFVVLSSLPFPKQSYQLGDFAFLNNRGLYLPRPDSQLYFYLFFIGITLGLFILLAGLLTKLAYQEKTKRLRRTLVGFCFGLSIGSLIIPSWHKPVLEGFNFSDGIVLIPELVSLLCALSIYTASYIAETVRAGIEAIPKGQWEAAESLGLTRGQTLSLVIIPQSLRIIIPPLTSQYLNLTKNSSLAAAVAYPDLVSIFAGTVLNQTGQAVEVIAITMTVYLSISLLISLFMNWFNKTYALREN